MEKVNICIIGAMGRMGAELMKAADCDPSVKITGAVEYKGSPKIGMDAAMGTGLALSGCIVTDDILAAAAQSDIIVDFSGAAGTLNNIVDYRKAGKPLLIGSTGLTDEALQQVQTLSFELPLIVASNMSLGINLLVKFVETAVKVLGDGYDVEIFEAHHRYKKDAPSGTAITLGKAAAAAMGVDFSTAAVYDREGITGERQAKTIGFQVLRGGNIAGDHTVFFCGENETIELTHRATNREPFAKGALRAAKWLVKQKNGLYTINDVMGLL